MLELIQRNFSEFCSQMSLKKYIQIGKAMGQRKNGARLAQMVRGLDLAKVIGGVRKGIQP